MCSQGSARLLGVLATLPERQQQVLHLVFYQDLSLREAAEVLGVRVGTARVHYERGKKRLRALLEKEV
jgi:RNA polymerase sigma-70 factor (ECF subfamily)